MTFRSLGNWQQWSLRALSSVTVGFLLLTHAPATGTEAGDANRGAVVWKQCKACHVTDTSASGRIGPHLYALFGRQAAAVTGYRYSGSMKEAGAQGLVWTDQTLERFLKKPKSLVPGTRMAFRGIKDVSDRRDLLAFLRVQTSASDQGVGKSARKADMAAPRDPPVDPAVLALKGDPAYGEYLASECVTCHRLGGNESGIPGIGGWPEQAFVQALHAYKSGARTHPAMRMIAGRLSNEEIAGLAAYFATQTQ